MKATITKQYRLSKNVTLIKLQGFWSSAWGTCQNASLHLMHLTSLMKLISSKMRRNGPEPFQRIFSGLPKTTNTICIVFLINHLVRVSKMADQNKMSWDNLATVSGPSLLHSGHWDTKWADTEASNNMAFGAQNTILDYFLSRSASGAGFLNISYDQ